MSLTARPLPPVTEADHSLGPQDAPVTLVEYGDLECQLCGEAHPVVERVRAHFGDRLRFVFRHFPIPSAHPHAQLAAEASEAAAAQGAFWPLFHKLYENQQHLERADLDSYAGELGLDLAAFDAALADGRYSQPIKDGFRAGLRAGVNGTPTFFINGQHYAGERDFAAMTAAIEQAMAQ